MLTRKRLVRASLWCYAASALVALVLFAGCASMTTEEKVSLGLVAADVGSTAYALDQGLSELNPLVRGHSDGETMLRAVALNAVLYWLQHLATRNDPVDSQKTYWRIVIGFRAPVVGWNLSQIARVR